MQISFFPTLFVDVYILVLSIDFIGSLNLCFYFATFPPLNNFPCKIVTNINIGFSWCCVRFKLQVRKVLSSPPLSSLSSAHHEVSQPQPFPSCISAALLGRLSAYMRWTKRTAAGCCWYIAACVSICAPFVLNRLSRVLESRTRHHVYVHQPHLALARSSKAPCRFYFGYTHSVY